MKTLKTSIQLNLDTDQWIRTLKETGFKRTIMVVKHHDGFCYLPI